MTLALSSLAFSTTIKLCCRSRDRSRDLLFQENARIESVGNENPNGLHCRLFGKNNLREEG